MTNNVIDIYSFIGSPPSRAVIMLLMALKLNHNIKEVNILAGEQNTPEYRKMNPLHTVPLIDDGGFIVYDSHAVMQYLVDQYAKDDSMYPTDPKKGAIVNQRLYFEATYLFRPLEDYMYHILKGLGINQDYLAQLEEAFQYLDGFLENEIYVAGQNLTIADFSVLGSISTAEAALIDMTKYPNLISWYTRMKNIAKENDYYDINQQGCDLVTEFMKKKLN